MPSWVTKALREKMLAIVVMHEEETKQALRKAKGGGTAALRSMSPDELFLLFCHFQSFPGIAKHAGIGRSSVSDIYRAAGCGMNELHDRLMGYEVDDEEEEEIDVRKLIEGRSEVERAEAKAEFFRRRLQAAQATIEKLTDTYSLYRDIISETIQEFPPCPVSYPQFPVPEDVDEELCILPISDVHIGECVLPERMGGLAHYNWEVFLQRIEQYKRGIHSIVNCHLRRSYPIRTALIFLLGDIVTGEDVFHKQLAHIDLPLVKQVVEGSMRLAEMIRWIATQFDNVRVYAVCGNHGETKTTTLNADYLLYTMMATALSSQPNLKFFISETHYMGIRIDRHQNYLDFGDVDREWNFLLTHGNQAKSYMGLPYYSLDRLVRKYSSMTGILWDKLFVGHHHQDVPGPRNSWCVAGSWVGGTEYSQSKMQGSEQPCQRIWGFHPNRGITWSYTIDLAERTRLVMRPGDDGIYTPHTVVERNDNGEFEYHLRGMEGADV